MQDNRKNIVQIGFLVKDLDSAAAAWQDRLGIAADFTETDDQSVTGAVYEGRPCYSMIRQAIFDLENIQIELIQPVNDEPSLWHDWLERYGEGYNHVAFKTQDMDAAIAKAAEYGYHLVQRGIWVDESGNPAGKYAYLDAGDSLKTIIELLES